MVRTVLQFENYIEFLNIIEALVNAKNTIPDIDFNNTGPSDKDFLNTLIGKLENGINNQDSNKEQADNHYFHNGIMAWDIINEILNYHEGGINNREAGIIYNIMRYLLRFPYKGQRNSDLKKAQKYIGELIKFDDENI